MPRIRRGPIPGDVIGVARDDGYQHFGILISSNQVIHYTNPEGEKSRAKVCQTSLAYFNYVEQPRLFYLSFPRKSNLPKIVLLENGAWRLKEYDAIDQMVNCSTRRLVKVYSGKNTIQRAREMLEKEDYSFFSNNCEHFAMWCKTGDAFSRQVVALKILVNMVVLRDRYNESFARSVVIRGAQALKCLARKKVGF